jgi:anti-sigma factor RsiW
MNQRDLELLSSYLDGQLKAPESARLEIRLKSDPELASALNDLRAARTLLRKLPQRRAPRNFTLTRKMVGQNPPLPRAYPFFRFATAIATLLFVFSVGLNSISTNRLGSGMGGGGGSPSNQELQSYAATQPPATQAPAAEAPALAATQAPTEAPTFLAPMAPLPTQTLEATDQARALDATAASKTAPDTNMAGQPPQPQPFGAQQTPALLVPSIWLIILAGIAILSAILMLIMRQLANSRWRK